MELLERDEALAELHRQFEESATVGRLVVVSGEAGIGKTALVAQAADWPPFSPRMRPGTWSSSRFSTR